MNPNCEVYGGGSRREDLTLPAGTWIFVDADERVRVSGRKMDHVLETSTQVSKTLGFDVEEGTFEKVPTPADLEFLYGGGSEALD